MRLAVSVRLNPEQKTALERMARQRSLTARLEDTHFHREGLLPPPSRGYHFFRKADGKLQVWTTGLLPWRPCSGRLLLGLDLTDQPACLGSVGEVPSRRTDAAAKDIHYP